MKESKSSSWMLAEQAAQYPGDGTGPLLSADEKTGKGW